MPVRHKTMNNNILFIIIIFCETVYLRVYISYIEIECYEHDMKSKEKKRKNGSPSLQNQLQFTAGVTFYEKKKGYILLLIGTI